MQAGPVQPFFFQFFFSELRWNFRCINTVVDRPGGLVLRTYVRVYVCNTCIDGSFDQTLICSQQAGCHCEPEIAWWKGLAKMCAKYESIYLICDTQPLSASWSPFFYLLFFLFFFFYQCLLVMKKKTSRPADGVNNLHKKMTYQSNSHSTPPQVRHHELITLVDRKKETGLSRILDRDVLAACRFDPSGIVCALGQKNRNRETLLLDIPWTY